MMGKMRPKHVWERRHAEKFYYYLESSDFEQLYDFAAEEIVKSECRSVLDVGCWTGMLLSALLRRGYSGLYTGFDISEGAIRECKNTFGYLDSASFLVHEWDKGFLDVPAESIYLGGILYYVSDRVSFLRSQVESYSPRLVLVQDLLKTECPSAQELGAIDYKCSEFVMPIEAHGDPDLSHRSIYAYGFR